MTRPVCLVDGSTNQEIIPHFSIRQAVTKSTGTGLTGNQNIDFTPADLTDPDGGDPPVLPRTVLMEPNQCYVAIINRLAQAALSQVLVININHFKGLGGAAVNLANAYKIMLADDSVVYRFRLHENQDTMRFRILGMAVTDNVQVSVAKMS